MTLLDTIWTGLSFLTGIGFAVSSAAPLLILFYLLYKLHKNPAEIFDDDSHVMSLLEAMSYDDYAEDYFNGKVELCIKERRIEIWKLFGKFLFVALLAKSAIAVVSLTILYAALSSVDVYLMHYYFKTYWEKLDEQNEIDTH